MMTPNSTNNRRKFQPYAWSELSKLPKRRPLIKGLLDCGTMSLVYGESNCGKTFMVLDIALHIILGNQWQGKKTRQGTIAYIAAEGGLGLKERLDAFRSYHNLDEYGPFYLIPTGINLCSSQSDLGEVIEELAILDGLELVVIDTLSRAMAGGNENNSDDMGKFIINCDKIRATTGAHVLIVHHSGKDTSKGARGHSALRAAVDTEIEVTKLESGMITAEIKKQRDGKTGDVFHFDLLSIPLGKDEDGDPISSCVLSRSDAPPAQKRRLSKQKERAIGVLCDKLYTDGKKLSPRTGMPQVTCITKQQAMETLRLHNISTADQPDDIRRAISRVLKELCDLGIMGTYGDYMWIADQADI